MTPPFVLLVEDNEDDRFLTQRALQKESLSLGFYAPDGRVAIDYLSGEGKYVDRKSFPLPDVVLLDLKLPVISGHQVLEWIQQQLHLRTCPVYVLSSSGEARDRNRADVAGATGYFVKPLTPEDIRLVKDKSVR